MPTDMAEWRELLDSRAAGKPVAWREWRDAVRGLVADLAEPGALALLEELSQHPHAEVRRRIAKSIVGVEDHIFMRMVRILAVDHNGGVVEMLEATSRYRAAIGEETRPRQSQVALKRKQIERKFGHLAVKEAVEYAQLVNTEHLRALSHDLRTTLTSLKGAAHRVGKARTDEDRKTHSSRIQKDVTYLHRLAKDIESFAVARELPLRPGLLRELVEDASRRAEEAVRDKYENAEAVELQILSTEEVSARVSAAHLVDALTNLIQNAIESHGDGRMRLRPGQVKVRVEARAGTPCVEIEDTGCGLDLHELAEVQEFVPGRSSKEGGTGYGLPIAQRHIEAHGGQLIMHSERGKGTLVLVRLPPEGED